jgi:hypothetical protein
MRRFFRSSLPAVEASLNSEFEREECFSKTEPLGGIVRNICRTRGMAHLCRRWQTMDLIAG